jgi:hypothetical protein
VCEEAVRSAEEAVRDAMLSGTPGQLKALLKELIVEVRVESRDRDHPDGPSSRDLGSRYGNRGWPRWTRTTYPAVEPR